MQNTLTEKGLSAIITGELFKDLAELWESRQEKLYDIGLDKLSEDYNEAIINLKQKILSSNNSGKINKDINELDAAITKAELISNSMFYKHGFSDGVKFLIQALMI